MANEVDFLSAVAGQGFEEMGSGDVRVPMLLLAQALSQVVVDDKVKAGHFYNSLSGEDYGDKLQIVPIAFTKKWFIWSPDNTLVGRVDPGSIKTVGDMYEGGLKDTDGNKVVETYMYLVTLPEHPEAGYMLYTSSPANMKYMRTWNTQMQYTRLPDGRQCPMFGGVWEMSTSQEKNKKGTFFTCSNAGRSSFVFKGFVSKEFFENTIQGGLTAAKSLMNDTQLSLEAPEDKSDTEEVSF